MFFERTDGFLSYLDSNYLVVLDEQSKINQRIDNIKIDNNNLIRSVTEKGRFIPDSIKKISEFILDLDGVKHINIEKTDVSIGNNNYYFDYRDVNFYKAETDIQKSSMMLSMVRLLLQQEHFLLDLNAKIRSF